MNLAAALVPDAAIRKLWDEFATELIRKRREDLKLKSRLEHAVNFFIELATAFPDGKGLDAGTFEQRIDSRLMRRHLLASRFVATRLGVADDSVRQDAIEARRLSELVAELPQDPAGEILRDYVRHMKASALAPRTQRLYLHAAHAFVSVVPFGHLGWKPLSLLRHLRRSPGQAASLGRFVTYCRRANGWDVAMPSRSEFASSDSEKAARQVVALRTALARVVAIPLDQVSEGQLIAILSPALGLSAAALRRMAPLAVKSVTDAIRLSPDALIEASDALHPYALRWANLQRGGVMHFKEVDERK